MKACHWCENESKNQISHVGDMQNIYVEPRYKTHMPFTAIYVCILMFIMHILNVHYMYLHILGREGNTRKRTREGVGWKLLAR